MALPEASPEAKPALTLAVPADSVGGYPRAGAGPSGRRCTMAASRSHSSCTDPVTGEAINYHSVFIGPGGR